MVDSSTLNIIKKRKHDPISVKQFEKLLVFLEEEGICFYNCEYPLVRERSEGPKHFVDVTISIRTSV